MGVYQQLLSYRTMEEEQRGFVQRSSWAIFVRGVDVTTEVNTDLLDMKITDNEEDEADDLQLTLTDRDGKWLLRWLNESINTDIKTKGLEFVVYLGKLDSNGEILQQKAGSFYLDSLQHSGPPAKVKIKATSLDFAGGIRDEERSRSWEGYSLEGVAHDIAVTAGMNLMYCSERQARVHDTEQVEETDIAFLKRCCQDAGMSLKCIDNNIVVFDKDAYGAQEPIRIFHFNDGQYTKWDLKTTSGDVDYDMCTVRYLDPTTGMSIEGTAYADDYDEDADDHTELVVTNVRVQSAGEAEQLAKERLKLRNQYEKTVTLTMPGDPTLMAGLPVLLSGMGYFDGRYMIKKCEHNIGSGGYTTKITLRMIPNANEFTHKISDDDD